MREIRYVLYREGDISLHSAAQGGSQGEDNVTEVVFEFDDALKSRIDSLSQEGDVYYRIKAIDGGGASHLSDHLSVHINQEGKTEVTYWLSRELTAAGGIISLFFIIAQLVNGATEKIWYSFPAKIMLNPTNYDKDLSASGSIDEALVAARKARDEAQGSASSAEAYKNEVAAFASEAKSAAENVASDRNIVKETYGAIMTAVNEVSINARNSQTAANDAEIAKTEAKQYAEEAELSASSAATSADDASSAKEATVSALKVVEDYANDAASSQVQAQEYAKQAKQAEEGAISAKDAAETYKNAAEEARDEAKSATEKALAEALVNTPTVVEGYPTGNSKMFPYVYYTEEDGYFLLPQNEYEIKKPEVLKNVTTTEECVAIEETFNKGLHDWITIYLEIPKASEAASVTVQLDNAHAGNLPNAIKTSTSYVRFSLRWNGRRWENYAIAGASATAGGNIYSTAVYNAATDIIRKITIGGGTFPAGTKYLIYGCLAE